MLFLIGARFGCLFPFNLRSVECPQLQSRTVFVKLIEIERAFDRLPILVMEKVKCSFLIASEQRTDRNEVLFSVKENSMDPFASSSPLSSQTSHKKWSLVTNVTEGGYNTSFSPEVVIRSDLRAATSRSIKSCLHLFLRSYPRQLLSVERGT